MRPRKYLKSRQLTITIDDKDMAYLDDHRGKVTRGDYLMESMYALKNESSQYLKNAVEKYKQASQENSELKRQLMFERSRNKRQTFPEISVFEDIDLIKWYNEKGMTEIIKTTNGINWKNLYEKNIAFLSLKFKDARALQCFCMERFKNNGGAKE